jgi:Zn-dependent alcohol dehydrogenase
VKGAGYVEKIGGGVKNAKDGDAVLLSFQSCGNCKDCKTKHPSFCQSFALLNYGGEENFTLPSDSKASGSFFGQSSFSSYAIVKESSVVNVTGLVKDEEELKMFAPMGCGFQTGVGTVERFCGADEEDAVVIMGLGGVGLSAIMVSYSSPSSQLLILLITMNIEGS